MMVASKRGVIGTVDMSVIGVVRTLGFIGIVALGVEFTHKET